MEDQNQLPCIAEKSIISNEVAKPNTTDAVWRILFHNFLNSNDNPNVKSTVVVIDEVIWQTDTGYLSLI